MLILKLSIILLFLIMLHTALETYSEVRRKDSVVLDIFNITVNILICLTAGILIAVVILNEYNY